MKRAYGPGLDHRDCSRPGWRKVIPVGVSYKLILTALPDRKPVVLVSGQ